MKKKEFKNLKISSFKNYIILTILTLFAFTLLLFLFIYLKNIDFIGADTEISSSSSYYVKSSNSNLSSPNNPRSALENEQINYNQLKKKNINKCNIISKLEPIFFSALPIKEKEELLYKIQSINQNQLTQQDVFNNIIPSFQIILSILYTDKFAKSIISKSYNDSPTGNFYQNFLFFRKIYFPLKNDIIELLNFYFNLYKDEKTNYNFTSKILRKSDYLYPKTKELKYNHQNAIDIFFKKVAKKNGEEIGPPIYSFTSGIVVVSENEWAGSTTLDSYIKGGISPKSGNGVIIYDPIGKRFILYFHLSQTNVIKGQIINAGELIGFGGNTGINARKAGHGKHLHLEIYDLIKDRFLNCYELKSILF